MSGLNLSLPIRFIEAVNRALFTSLDVTQRGVQQIQRHRRIGHPQEIGLPVFQMSPKDPSFWVEVGESLIIRRDTSEIDHRKRYNNVSFCFKIFDDGKWRVELRMIQEHRGDPLGFGDWKASSWYVDYAGKMSCREVLALRSMLQGSMSV